ncbi:MAG: RNA polymerase sigma factor [Blastocatellia bacterium]
MRKDWEITEDAFDKFLSWLHPNREQAGKKYEDIRRHLIIILNCRGCAEAEDLADETINRVIRRAQQMVDTYHGEPLPYFITVAHNLYLEYAAKRRTWLELPAELPLAPQPDPEAEREYECLERCVQKLTPANRDMVLQYYQENKQAKIDHRKQRAERMGIALNALRIRAYRIRVGLEQCIDECLTSLPMK